VIDGTAYDSLAEEWKLLGQADVQHWTGLGPRRSGPVRPGQIRERDRSWYVYRMWDASSECLYVGSTGWLRKRMNDHRARARGDWLNLVTEIDICPLPTRQLMEAAEDYWFLRMSPWFNRLRPVNLARRAETAAEQTRIAARSANVQLTLEV
jgi:hypothetical protein